MYDAMNEPHEFVGESREDAIARACKFFGTTLEALAITEFRPGEIYGLGGRFAIVAAPRNRTPVARGGGGLTTDGTLFLSVSWTQLKSLVTATTSRPALRSR